MVVRPAREHEPHRLFFEFQKKGWPIYLLRKRLMDYGYNSPSEWTLIRLLKGLRTMPASLEAALSAVLATD